jgi:hypothetical protein
MMHLVCAIFASRGSIPFPHDTAITIFISDPVFGFKVAS